MFQVISRAASLHKTYLLNSIPASVIRSVRFEGETKTRNEAPIIDNETILALPKEVRQNEVLECTIEVPIKVDLTPVSGVPEEHIRTRRVRIYQPSKNAMQAGTNNINHWEMEFDNRLRWENPLMGWTSTGDPLSTLRLKFRTPDEAVELCEKNGWCWFIDTPRIPPKMGPKVYAINFSWNRRTRVSTK